MNLTLSPLSNLVFSIPSVPQCFAGISNVFTGGVYQGATGTGATPATSTVTPSFTNVVFAVVDDTNPTFDMGTFTFANPGDQAWPGSIVYNGNTYLINAAPQTYSVNFSAFGFYVNSDAYVIAQSESAPTQGYIDSSIPATATANFFSTRIQVIKNGTVIFDETYTLPISIEGDDYSYSPSALTQVVGAVCIDGVVNIYFGSNTNTGAATNVSSLSYYDTNANVFNYFALTGEEPTNANTVSGNGFSVSSQSSLNSVVLSGGNYTVGSVIGNIIPIGLTLGSSIAFGYESPSTPVYITADTADVSTFTSSDPTISPVLSDGAVVGMAKRSDGNYNVILYNFSGGNFLATIGSNAPTALPSAVYPYNLIVPLPGACIPLCDGVTFGPTRLVEIKGG